MIENAGADIHTRVASRLTDKNIDPLEGGDKYDWLLPGLGPEHIKRYEFAGQIANEISLSPGSSPVKIVDAASGQGYGAWVIKDIIPNAKIYGVEIDLPSVKKAVRRYAPKNSGNIAYIAGDVREMPIASETADVSTAFEVMEHLEKVDQQTFLQELIRITKPGGRIIISVPFPHTFHPNKQGELVRGVSGSGSHKYEPSREEVIGMLQEAGLELQKEYGQSIVGIRKAQTIRHIGKYLPVFAPYNWTIPRDHAVHPIRNDPTKTALTHIFVAQKPLQTPILSSPV